MPDTIDTDDLLPCPFCGEAAWLSDYEAGFGDMTFKSLCPQCKFCGCNLGYFPTAKKAIAAWNLRADGQHDAEPKRGRKADAVVVRGRTLLRPRREAF